MNRYQAHHAQAMRRWRRGQPRERRRPAHNKPKKEYRIMKRYKARPGHILRVGLFKVTDDPRGMQLRENPCVREHVRLGRLIPVEQATPHEPEQDPAPVSQSKAQDDAVPAKHAQRRGQKETAHE